MAQSGSRTYTRLEDVDAQAAVRLTRTPIDGLDGRTLALVNAVWTDDDRDVAAVDLLYNPDGESVEEYGDAELRIVWSNFLDRPYQRIVTGAPRVFGDGSVLYGPEKTTIGVHRGLFYIYQEAYPDEAREHGLRNIVQWF